jgi:hypothetical protein
MALPVLFQNPIINKNNQMKSDMRRTLTIVLTLAIMPHVYAQEESDTTKVGTGKRNIVTVTEEDDGTEVIVQDEFVIVDDRDDTVKIKLGNKAISITEDGDKTHIEIIEREDFHKHGWKERPCRFKGHWSGFEFGMNNLVDRNGNLTGTTEETRWLDLNTGKSWEWNLNFIQYSLPFSRKNGLVTGMGIKCNDYHFDNNNNITKDPVTGVIVPRYPPDGSSYSKSKLHTAYLTVPLLLEFQWGRDQKGFITAGVIGDLKLWSSTRIKWYENATKQREKVKGDFSLSPLRYHVTLRAGYKFIKLYANLSMVSLFKSNMGPEAYPFTVGLTILNFR